MPRVQSVEQSSAVPATAAAFNTEGMSRRTLIATMARRPVVGGAHAGFAQALSVGASLRRSRERVALVVGEPNARGPRVDEFALSGRRAGLTRGDTKEARRARSHDTRERAAMAFARKVVRDRGGVADTDVEDVGRAGYTDGRIGENVANIALSISTNDFNHVAGTDVKLPALSDLAA